MSFKFQISCFKSEKTVFKKLETLNLKPETVVCFVILFTLIIFPIWADSTDEFVEKADAAKIKYDKLQKDYREEKELYENIALKINDLKKNTKDDVVSKVISGLKLKYYLYKGNEHTYKMSVLSGEIKETNEELFTYVSLILGKINSDIEECLKSRCGKIQQIYDKRTKWAMLARENDDIFDADISLEQFSRNMDREAKEDVMTYIDKRIIQTAQRQYLLSEEKRILEKMKNEGIKIDKIETEDIDARMAELKVYSALLNKELHRFKMKKTKNK